MKYIFLSIFIGAVFLVSLQDGATAHTKTTAAGRNAVEGNASRCAHCQVDDDTSADLCELGSYRALYNKILQHQLHRDTSYWPGSIDISAIDSDYDC